MEKRECSNQVGQNQNLNIYVIGVPEGVEKESKKAVVSK